ncbi:extracellular tyrosine-protein kinase PKDCC-like [Haliotis rufescens]|uniref:extracellular tyrosine-protein kinase PKDCC-like n=1 Tax=Haliotis rufescens TaxID=6454 RepID=UPI00201EAAB6|nr:extracellular tyrosine-protein kinase PKDCC-like [Haliotis rufescens]XP_046338867.2 extracellular tyrosine-protein kinase PKDCC-like [Haliotis rufescens]XP_046338875.2 extracellular tyrosine-protein kinase PKDCC-like [Haliotis rufescens]XP_046338883.2 extracellular tyrosine-protein kinase PKDCC-like [Haliotis rufescens]XP_046338892.2 extracellular tyrosine-protein kinase PKDCC-like [Haliotis rufescens]XP_046338900.2 extracellular tyrosine-protein kinase PKDCC-like [Haliotis rufescens]XP_04
MGLRRRYRRPTDNVWYIAASCVIFFLVGNLLMFQSYHTFVDDVQHRGNVHSPHVVEVSPHSSLVRDLTDDLLSRSYGKTINNQYFVFESRLRKLMEDTRENVYAEGLSSSHTPQIQGTPVTGDSMLNCNDIENITEREFIASGWTKAVFKGKYKGRSMAVKTVYIGGQDINTCIQQGVSMEECYHRAAQKIVKEIVVLQALPHENVIKVIGFCVPKQRYDGDSNTAVVMVTELGETIDLIKLLQLSWEDRLRISYDMTRLLRFMSTTPFGSMAMNDFRRQQFVLVNGQLKLSDVDDVGFDEPKCQEDRDCSLHFSSSNFTKRMPCLHGRCNGFNEMRNTFNAGRHFTTFLLPHGAPPLLKSLIDRVVDAYENLSLDSRQLVDNMEKIVSLYKSGSHLNRTAATVPRPAFIHYKESDLPGQFDYRCRFSMSGGGCTLSVFDRQEAEDLCNLDPDCKGFVFTNQKTWTGRTIVHLKNGVAAPTHNSKTELYLRPS